MKKAIINPKNYGFIEPLIKETDFRFGSGQINSKIIRMDGQWDGYLPIIENQVRNIDTYNCTSFGTLNQLEIFLKAKYREEINLSDRDLGIRAGTRPPGNDPVKVMDTLRKQGSCVEELLPFSENIKSVEDYYSYDNNKGECDKSAKELLSQYKYTHDWVHSTKISKADTEMLKHALRYSPLAVGVYAWAKDGDKYIRLGDDSHWTVIFGYEDGKYWKCFDSYDGNVKHLAWDFGFYFVKRINIEKQLPDNEALSWYEKFIELIKKYIDILTMATDNKVQEIEEQKKIEEVKEEAPKEVVEEVKVEEKTSKIKIWAQAIADFENFNSTIHNNPGAIRGTDGKFLKFKSYDEGFDYLCNYLIRAATGKHKAYPKGGETTIIGFFQIYAPVIDNNRPDIYAKFAAGRLKETLLTPIKNLL